MKAAVLALLASLSAVTAQARGVRVGAERVESSSIIAQGIEIQLADGEGGARLAIDIARVAVAASPGDPVAVHAECTLRRTAEGWRCSGSGQTQARGTTARADVDATLANGRLVLDLARKPARLRIAQGADAWTFALDDLPLAWFDGVLRAWWADAKPAQGRLAADLAWKPAEPSRVRGSYRVDGFGLDADGGRVAAAALTFGGKVTIDAGGAQTAVEHTGAIESGELLFGDFYTRFANRVAVDASLSGAGARWSLRSMRYDDPGALSVRAAATFDAGASSPLVDWRLETFEATLPAAFERYAKSLLAPRGFGELATHGVLRGSAQGDAGLAAFAVDAESLDIADAAQRFALQGGAGRVEWRREGEAGPTRFGWQSLDLYKLKFGAASTRWRSRDGVLGLAEPASLPVFDGALDIAKLAVRPDAARGERVAAGFAVHGVDMAQLSAAFGWPSFGGKLGGAVPEVRYAGDRIELDGGLMLAVFDGTINITGLALERPFGVAPTLAADIAFSNLDLTLLTGTFDFGEISGRLSGAVKALRLVDWAPVSFDADLHALDGGKISQRAVNSLSVVGGGGFVAGLQASVLRFFDTFGYSRLAIGCVLADNVCAMRGLDSSPQGYTLVDGRGLPRIRIVGHQAKVDWPVLVERLKAATSGTAPIVE